MNIETLIQLRAGYQDHAETYNGISPIPTAHPPSLRNPKKVLAPLGRDGWRKKDSKRKKKRARADLKVIMERTLRQAGKPVLIRHAVNPVPSLFTPL